MNQPSQAPATALRLTPLAALIASSSFAALVSVGAHAQTPPAPANVPEAEVKAAKSDVSGLERVVVTATAKVKSKLRSSVSVTDIDQEQIKEFGARTEAEVLLLIPGIRTDATAGAGGNANISVRGLPISSGGSKYVQLQEDGLPTVQFGDMNFSNNDYWIRFDNNVDTIQTLRGGSSSVFASHAPGAVLNYISKTGKQQGGSVGLTTGLNFNEKRFDGNYGGSLGQGLRFHVGGYYREGQGIRKNSDRAVEGYQIKANVTKEFNDGKGWFRVYFKALDEHAPANAQSFLSASLNGTRVSGFSRTPSYDGTRDSEQSIYNASVPGIDPLTRQLFNADLRNGITVNSKSLGFEFHNALANGFTIDNKFRKSVNSGAFQAQFWNVRTLADLLGSSGNTARYYNGPRAGQLVTAANLQTGLVSDSAAINTQFSDMGNVVNDLSVAKTLQTDFATFDVKGGLFFSRQNVVQRWMISERVMEVGRDGALIDLYNPAGAALTTAGLTGYNNQWGGCCARDIDAQFSTTAPYLSLNAAVGGFDFDAGVRRETFKADGSYAAGSRRAFDVDGNGTITGAENNVYLINPQTPRGLVNYKINYTNHSLGVNYRFTNDFSAFVRQSEGTRAIADRLLFSPNIDAASGMLAPGGGREAALAPVKQSEIGVKTKGNLGALAYGASATLFRSTTTEFDYDQTRQDNPNLPNYAGPKLNVLGYKATGLELETAASMGNFSINVNVVYSNEEVTKDLVGSAIGNSSVGKTSGGVPKLRYTISPRYSFGNLTLGAAVRGQSWVYTGNDNVNKIDGHYIVSAFANYEFGNGITGSLNVNNLLDKVYPAGGGGFVGGSSSIFGTGAENGRTISASLRYSF